jgi:mRNA interferase RelE/StbE
VRAVIEHVEQATDLLEIPNVRRLTGDGLYYRIRVGDYRIGITVEQNVVTFVRVLHRRDIYRYFP